MYDDRNRPRHGGRGDQRGQRRGTPLSDLDPALTEVSRRVIGCAIEVHKAIGPGFDRSVYANALKIEMDAEGIPYKAEHKVPVTYRDKQVGARTADFLIDDRFIIELMAERIDIGGAERASLRAMLRAADLELGLIVNFGERRLTDGLVRVLNPDKLNAMREQSEHDDEDEEDEHDEEDSDEHDEDESGSVFDPDEHRG